jgi:cell division FtsZ-interacting protein ZapD
MADAISLIAAVIGIADVSVRLGREVVEIISQLKDASTEICRLRGRTEELTEVVQQIHVLGQRYSASSLGDATEASFKTVEQVLQSCKKDLDLIQAMLREIDQARDSVIGRASRRIKAVMNDRKLAKISQRLETHKATLSTSLSTIGR